MASSASLCCALFQKKLWQLMGASGSGGAHRPQHQEAVQLWACMVEREGPLGRAGDYLWLCKHHKQLLAAWFVVRFVKCALSIDAILYDQEFAVAHRCRCGL